MSHPSYSKSSALRLAEIILGISALVILAHAFVPLDEFIHRTDDAYYYFKVAFNYPATGFWTFDTLHSTNGVQPLWAVLLTGAAQLMAWIGLRDADLFARVIVAMTAAFHIGSCVFLLRLLSRQVSLGVGIAAAIAFLLPLGIVWQRVWGMENSLYAFFLLATLNYYAGSFRERESTRGAVILGLLFGVTALSRLNAVLFAICGVGAIVLTARDRLNLTARLRYGAIVAAVSASCVIPYLAYNFATTGHPLPISGAVKAVLTKKFLAHHGVENHVSIDFAKLVVAKYKHILTTFFTARLTDGFTVLGVRLLTDRSNLAVLLAAIGLAAVGPLLLGSAAKWWGSVRWAYARLKPFAFVAVFAAINFGVSVFTYPHQLSNAMLKWWLVENELVLTVLAATLAGTAAAYGAKRFLSSSAVPRALAAGLAVLVAGHAVQTVRFFWDGRVQTRDWNASWNEECLLAAQWMAKNVPETEIAGSWNAGVFAYYSKQRVVNLDGLINNFDLVPYLRDQTLGDYIKKEKITYLSDMASIFKAYKIPEQLTLREVYSHHNHLLHEDYKIYKVEY